MILIKIGFKVGLVHLRTPQDFTNYYEIKMSQGLPIAMDYNFTKDHDFTKYHDSITDHNTIKNQKIFMDPDFNKISAKIRPGNYHDFIEDKFLN